MAFPIQNNTRPNVMMNASPLAFVFSGTELIIQCISSTDNAAAAVNTLDIALRNYQNFNDGKHAAIVRCKDSTQYWITSVPFAETLNKNVFEVIKTTAEPAVQPPIATRPITRAKVTKAHIRRPRNQFIIYRQWMSAKIHASNPGVTAACISQIVAQMWRVEREEVKAHFQALAAEENRLHKAQNPGYRYVPGRRNPQLPPSKRDLTHNPMNVAERLIASGF